MKRSIIGRYLYAKIKPINVIMTKLNCSEICPKKICRHKPDEMIKFKYRLFDG